MERLHGYPLACGGLSQKGDLSPRLVPLLSVCHWPGLYIVLLSEAPGTSPSWHLLCFSWGTLQNTASEKTSLTEEKTSGNDKPKALIQSDGTKS